MAPQPIDRATLDDLKRDALARAHALGHQLEPFRTARHDPLCHVSFCAACRQMVIVSLTQEGEDRPGRLYGYALEAPCTASGAGRQSELAAAAHAR